MADQAPFSLEIKDPEWKIALPSGVTFPDGSSTRSYDPWEVVEKLSKMPRGDDGSPFNFPYMREVFGFPNPEVAKEQSLFTPSRNQLMELSA